MTDKINSYFAILLVTIAGAAASMLIIHAAYSRTIITVFASDAVIYEYGNI